MKNNGDKLTPAERYRRAGLVPVSCWVRRDLLGQAVVAEHGRSGKLPKIRGVVTDGLRLVVARARAERCRRHRAV